MGKIKKGNVIKVGLIAALLGIIYYPAFLWMWGRWNAAETYYSHGPLIPLAALFFLWNKKDSLSKIAQKPSNWGIAFILLGLILHLAGVWAGVYFISGFSFIILITGLVIYFFGWQMLREVSFPILFLVFMVPLPLVLIADINFKLKMLATHWSVITLNQMGLLAVQEGSTIKMPNSYLLVEGQCSGLKYLISLVAFGSAFAYIVNKENWAKWLIFLATPFIALMANMFRIVFLGWVSDVYGMKAAQGFVHDFSGFLLFFTATIGLVLISSLLPSKMKKEG